MQTTNFSCRRRVTMLAVLLVALLALTACGGTTAPPTSTPTPSPTPTPTPVPTPTPKPVDEANTEAAVPAATPEVTIPSGFKSEVDDALGYSLALPGGWTNLDLRSNQFRTMANTFGLADQLAPLNDFLESPEGEAVGIVAITDLTSVMFGGLPTLLNVSVIDAPGATSDQVETLVAQVVEDNAALMGAITVESLEATTINNLPAVAATIAGDLSSVGMNSKIYAKVVGLIANDKVYLLTLATEAGNRADREAVFDQVIGTFRPE